MRPKEIEMKEWAHSGLINVLAGDEGHTPSSGRQGLLAHKLCEHHNTKRVADRPSTTQNASHFHTSATNIPCIPRPAGWLCRCAAHTASLRWRAWQPRPRSGSPASGARSNCRVGMQSMAATSQHGVEGALLAAVGPGRKFESHHASKNSLDTALTGLHAKCNAHACT